MSVEDVLKYLTYYSNDYYFKNLLKNKEIL